MAGKSKFEHAKVRVEDPDAVEDFYTDVLGLTLMEKSNGTVYYGCGLDENYDIALEAGEQGLDHFAIRVSEDDLEKFEKRFADHGIETERTDGQEPNVAQGLLFEMPMGAMMELVVVEDTRYLHSDESRLGHRSGHTPLDSDHITFQNNNVRENVEWLVEEVDFKNSEVLIPDGGSPDDPWKGAFTRYDYWHHDIGWVDLKPVDGYLMSHVAWTMANIDHMKMFIDHLADAGYRLDISIFRHYAGDNLAAYFWGPGGTRFEICCEMATVDDEAPTDYTEFHKGFSIWGVEPGGPP